MAHVDRRGATVRARSHRAIALILALAPLAGAEPITAPKLELLPHLWPRERRELVRSVQPLLERGEPVAPALLAAGVDPRVVARLQAIADGPLLAERFAHGIAFEAPAIDARQRALLEHVVAGVEAAQFALHAHRERLLSEWRLPPDDPTRRRLRESTDRQIRDIERRFWRVVDWTLTVPQRASLRRLYPPSHAGVPNLQGHVALLAGLTTSQAARIQSLVREFESESAADAAETRRLRARLASDDLPAAERRALEAAAEAAGDRLADRLEETMERGRTLLSAEQVRALDARVPFVSPEERARDPREMLAGMRLRPAQRERIQALATAAERRARAARERAAAGRRGLAAELGAESPQAMTMRQMDQRAQGAVVAALEEAAHTAVLEVLEPRQILPWILGPR